MRLLAGRLRARLLVLAAVSAVAGPLALLAGAADSLPMTRCADSSTVTRAGDWEAVRAPAFALRPGGHGADVTAFAVHPARPATRFATNGTSVERTDDAGCTWREVYALPQVPSEEDSLAVATAQVQELVLPTDPRGHDVLLLVVRDANGGPRVLVSEDGGRAEPFRDRSEGLPATGTPTDLMVAPTNPDFLFLGVEAVPQDGPAGGAGLPVPLPDLPALPELPGVGGSPTSTSPGALFGSVDGGLTWEARLDLADLGGSTSGVDLLAGHPASPNRLWAVSDGVLRSSTDGGRTFAGPGPTAQQQADRGWRVTAVATQTLVGERRSRPTTLVYAFSATSAQGGGPVVLLSADGGETYDESPAPGVVDSAAAFLPGSGVLVASTRQGEGAAAGVHVLRPGGEGVAVEDVTPGVDAASYAAVADLSERPTFHARVPGGLLRYVGPAAALPPEIPPLVGGVVSDALPPLGPASLSPDRDEVRLEVGESMTVPHVLVPPRRPSPLDLFLLVDTSESMADDLDRVSADLLAMVAQLQATELDVSVGLGEFKGGESSVAYRRVTGVGPGIAPLREGLTSLVADGFGEETQLIALEQALEGRGEQADAMVPAPCKLSLSNPDRYVQDERRTAPPVLPGQQADFRPGSVPVVLVVTDTNFLRPAGTRLKPDCTVDVTTVAQRYAAAGVHVAGLGVDDVDNPQRAADLLELARTTGAQQPAGSACAAGIDPAGAAVCRRAVDLVPALSALATRPSEPFALTVTSTSPVTTAPAQLQVDLRRGRPVELPVTYTCDEAGTFDGVLEVRLRAQVVATLMSRVVCDEVPVLAPPPPAVVAAVPLVGLLPPPVPVPPPAPPAQAVQPQVQPQAQAQAQAQAQTGAQEQERTAAELALALQSTAQDEQLSTSAMSTREVPDVVRLSVLAGLTAAAGAVAVRRRVVPVRAPGTRR